MGIYRTKQEIVRSAIRKVSSIPTPASSSFVSPEEENYTNVLNELIAEEMESTIYPFAVTYMELGNPIIDETLNPEDDRLIYSIPSFALDIGIFDENSLPSVAAIIEDSSTVRASSYQYSFFGSDRLILAADPDEEITYYFVHTSIDPPVNRMFTSFQRFLIYQLAYENYFKVGTNSKFLESLRLSALRKKSVAKRLCISNAQDFNKNIVTLNEILEYGKPDGRA